MNKLILWIGGLMMGFCLGFFAGKFVGRQEIIKEGIEQKVMRYHAETGKPMWINKGEDNGKTFD